MKKTDKQLYIHLVNYSLEQNITLIPSASSARLTALMWIQEIGRAMPVSPTISYWTGHVFLVPLFVIITFKKYLYLCVYDIFDRLSTSDYLV